jgi:hypothetical protein
MRLDLEQCRSAVERDIDQKILVRQDPLQSRGKLLIIIDHQNGFQLETIGMRLKCFGM